MSELNYIIIIVILTVFIIIYGGHNNQKKIEYEADYFKNLNRIILFEKKLSKYNNEINFGDSDFINIEKYIKSCHTIIPNLVDLFFIKIKSQNIFQIKKIFKKNYNEHIMIIFNHNKVNDLELIIGYDYNSNGYFYDLEKIISITGLYDIHNNSSDDIIITLFFIKKPYWH